MPRNYIPSVEEGVVDALKQGPLGFPVVDVAVTLTDGSYHTVDSSDMAFRTAGRIGAGRGLPQCQPVLLEPIHLVEIVCPNDATATINAILSGRRGQILGFDTREGWDGWDTVRAQMAEAEIGDLIIEVRSATAGVGSFTFKFDHMAELTGRTADQIVAARRAADSAFYPFPPLASARRGGEENASRIRDLPVMGQGRTSWEANSERAELP